MSGTEICPKCGTKFDGVWWQNAETENKQLREQLAAERELKDEARQQREWLIKECKRIGVTVNVKIGAPITEAYQLVNAELAVEREKVEIAERSAKAWEEDAHRYANNLAAATARELHSYDVAKQCREELAAAVEALELALQVFKRNGFNTVIIEAALARIGEGE